jgi:hypothetical protein
MGFFIAGFFFPSPLDGEGCRTIEERHSMKELLKSAIEMAKKFVRPWKK